VYPLLHLLRSAYVLGWIPHLQRNVKNVWDKKVDACMIHTIFNGDNSFLSICLGRNCVFFWIILSI
jgi:hypothetical protein